MIGWIIFALVVFVIVFVILKMIGREDDDSFIGRTMNRIDSGCGKIVKMVRRHDC